MSTSEEVTELAKRIWKEKGGRDDLEWGAVDESVRLFYRVLAWEELRRGNGQLTGRLTTE